jgi:hypothetical protein
MAPRGDNQNSVHGSGTSKGGAHVWVFTVDGFYSVVRQDDFCQEDEVVVRARVRRDLERFLQKLEAVGAEGLAGREILEGVGTDYAFRTVVKRAEWSRYLAVSGEETTYPTFKSLAAAGDSHRSAAYYAVWSRLYEWQETDGAAGGHEWSEG